MILGRLSTALLLLSCRSLTGVTAQSVAPTPAPTTTPRVPTVSPSPTRSLGRPYCNICGEGTENVIGEQTAVVNFPDPDDPSTMRRFPCSELQNLVNRNNVFHNEDVCAYIFPYTYATCRCTTPEGELLSDLLVPTAAPAVGGTPTAANGPTDGSGAGTIQCLLSLALAGAAAISFGIL